MGKGVLAGGIVVLVIGIIISALSSSAQSYTSRSVSQCDSFGGQIGQFFSDETRGNCANAVTYQSASSGGIMLGWGIVALGVVLAVVGGIQTARSSARNKKAPRYESETSVDTIAGTSSYGQGKIFCRYCGKLRPVSGTFCSECTKPTNSGVADVKKCSFCAASMSADSEFCANCGRKF